VKVQALVDTLSRSYMGYWLGKFEAWSDAGGGSVSIKREAGRWTIRAQASSKRVFSYTHMSFTVAAAHVWAQLH